MVSISKYSPPICANGLKSQRLEPPTLPSLIFHILPHSSSYLFTTSLLAPTPSFTFSTLSSPIYPPYGCFSQLQLRSSGRDEAISLPPLCSHVLRDGAARGRVQNVKHQVGNFVQTKEQATNNDRCCVKCRRVLANLEATTRVEESVFSLEISCFYSFCG